MIKYFILLSVLLFTKPVLSQDTTKPDLVGIQLESTVDAAEKACKKNKGKWLASHLNLFSCKTKGFHASIETNAVGNVSNIYVVFKHPKFYNEELKAFAESYSDIRNTLNSVNKTLINEFNNNEWVAIFMSFGENGNYTAHLYSIKDILNK